MHPMEPTFRIIWGFLGYSKYSERSFKGMAVIKKQREKAWWILWVVWKQQN